MKAIFTGSIQLITVDTVSKMILPKEKIIEKYLKDPNPKGLVRATD